MSSPVLCFKSLEKVSNIVEVLRSYTFNGFPVVDALEEDCAGDPSRTPNVLRGLILRSQLTVLLKHKVWL